MVLQYGSSHVHRLIEQPGELANAKGMVVYRCACGDRQERARSWDDAVKKNPNGSWPMAQSVVWFVGDKLPYYEGREAGLND